MVIVLFLVKQHSSFSNIFIQIFAQRGMLARLSPLSQGAYEDMSTTESNVRKRGRKVTRAQIMFLTDYMMRHNVFALGLYSSLPGKDHQKTLWADLSANLNTLGSIKSIQKWQKVWCEIKSKARLKFQKLRSQHSSDLSLLDHFSDVEKKVLSIIGIDLNEDNFPGSIPEDTRTHHALYEGKPHGLDKADMCSEVIIPEGVSCKVEAIDDFCIDGESHSIGCSSEEDIEPGTSAGDSVLSACDSVPQRSSRKRTLSFNGQDSPHKRRPGFLQKSIEESELAKGQSDLLMSLLSSQQEMVQVLLNSQQEILQGLLSSQQKIVQELQTSQQEIAQSVINFMNRRADLDERAIRLEEERLKLEERRLTTLSMQKDRNGL